MKRKKKLLRGAKRMAELGRRQAQIWMMPNQHQAIETRAQNLGLTTSGFILLAALRAAEKDTPTL